MEMKFNNTVNDDAIRIAQLGEAITAISRNREPDTGIILNSLQAEIDFRKERIKLQTEAFRRYGNTWRL